MIHEFKKFEAVKWYHKGKLDLDDSDTNNSKIEVGDTVRMINKKNAIVNPEGRCDDSANDIGQKCKVISIGTRGGYDCFQSSYWTWYKLDCFEKVEDENEAVKWYYKGKLDKDEDPPEHIISIGDTVIMKDRDDAFWCDIEFISSDYRNGEILGTVDRIDEQGGELCVRVDGNRWYKIENVGLEGSNEAVKWYHKGKFEKDADVDIVDINIGDIIRMKNRNGDLWTGHYFDNSGFENDEIMGNVTDVKDVNDVPCVQINGGFSLYRMDCVEKLERKNEAVRWYYKGKLEPDPDENINIIPTFRIGEKILLINKKNAYWDNGRFRDSVRNDNDIQMEVEKDHLKEINGHLCVYCRASGWYKVDCVEKIENEAVKWYHKGKLEQGEDNGDNRVFDVGDHIMIKKDLAWWNGHKWKHYGKGDFTITDMKLSEDITKEDYEIKLRDTNIPPIKVGKFYYKLQDKWPWFNFNEEDAEII